MGKTNDEKNYKTTTATGHFADSNLSTEMLTTAVNNQTHENFGFTTPDEILISKEIHLHSMENKNFQLFSDDHIEILNFKNQLSQYNINEKNINLMNKNQRLLIGEIFLKYIAEHFSMKTVTFVYTSQLRLPPTFEGGEIFELQNLSNN